MHFFTLLKQQQSEDIRKVNFETLIGIVTYDCSRKGENHTYISLYHYLAGGRGSGSGSGSESGSGSGGRLVDAGSDTQLSILYHH